MTLFTDTPLSNSHPIVTISIVSHGNALDLHRLLTSLAEHECMKSLQIIIIDNLGNDIPDIHLENCIIFRNKQTKGFASNQNFAFCQAKGKYFCILNPDIIFIQSVFDDLVNRIESGQADIVAPLITDAQGVIQDSFRDFPTPLSVIRRRLLKQTLPTPPISQVTFTPDWLSGMFLFMRVETFQRLGGFDEKFHLYFEDVDFCLRARSLGLLPLVDTNLRIQHNAQRASRKKIRYLLWHLQSSIRFFRSTIYKNTIKTQK